MLADPSHVLPRFPIGGGPCLARLLFELPHLVEGFEVDPVLAFALLPQRLSFIDLVGDRLIRGGIGVDELMKSRLSEIAQLRLHLCHRTVSGEIEGGSGNSSAGWKFVQGRPKYYSAEIV